MPKLKRVSGKAAIRVLERLGFEQIRQRGSHVVLKKQTPEGGVGCVVPMDERNGRIVLAVIHNVGRSNSPIRAQHRASPRPRRRRWMDYP